MTIVFGVDMKIELILAPIIPIGIFVFILVLAHLLKHTGNFQDYRLHDDRSCRRLYK